MKCKLFEIHEEIGNYTGQRSWEKQIRKNQLALASTDQQARSQTIILRGAKIFRLLRSRLRFLAHIIIF